MKHYGYVDIAYNVCVILISLANKRDGRLSCLKHFVRLWVSLLVFSTVGLLTCVAVEGIIHMVLSGGCSKIKSYALLLTSYH